MNESSEPGFLARPTFRRWVAHNRATPKWAELDAWFARSCPCDLRARTIKGVLLHIRMHDEPDKPTVAIIRQAFRAYREFLQSGEVIPRRIGPPILPPERRRKRVTHTISQETYATIEQLRKNWGARSRTEVISAAIAIAYERNPKRPPRRTTSEAELKKPVSQRGRP